MIQRIRDRRTFVRLRRHGRRLNGSTLWCTWCPEPELTATQVAFAIGRACGPAVVRNRLRRRLRALLREIDIELPLPTGMMLIGAKPGAVELTFDELRTELSTLIDRLRPEGSRV